MPRRDPRRPDRQGAARRRADHPHHPGRRRKDGSRGGLAIAAGRGACVSRRRPDRRGADRAVAGAPARFSPALWAWLRGLPPPVIPDLGGVAIAGAQTRGTTAQARGLGKRGPRGLLLPARRGGGHAGRRALAVRLLGAAGFLGRARQFLLDSARLFRDRAARRRPHLRHGQRRHRSLRRLGAGAFGRDRRGHHEGHEPRSLRRRRHRHRRRRAGRRDQRLAHRLCRPARLHRDARHVLLGARHRLVDRGRHPAQRLSRILQPHRPQPVRTARCARNRAGQRPGARRRQGGQRADDLRHRRRGRRRHRPRQYAVRREGATRSAATSARRLSPASTRAASASPRCSFPGPARLSPA